MSGESRAEVSSGDADPVHWPLSGWRVLDLSSEIAGPYATKLLVDAGAEVVKVEHPDGGDPLRRWTASGTAIPDGEDGVLFQFLNAGKRSIALDLESEDGRREALELAAGVDLVVESFGPGGLERRGLGPAVLQAARPALSLLSISPWGLHGPAAERPATEFTLQAATGSIAYRGLRDRKPVCAGGRIGEWGAGSFGAVAALAAMLSARNTGRGQHVDLSIFECMVLSLTVYHDLNSQWFPGPLPRSIEIPSIERAKDGWVGICAITGQQWKDFCVMVGRPDIGDDDAYLDGRARMEHLALMKSMMDDWMRDRSVEEIVETANLLRIPAAPVGNGRTLPEMDQMKARDVFGTGPGGFLRPRPPYRLEHTPPRPFAPAPSLGEHSEAIRAAKDTARPMVTRAEGGGALPFEGLRVLDMTTFWAGPIATALLADLGADVVKVESTQRPDGMRFAGAVRNEQLWEWSPVFHGANPGKRGITLRLDSEQGMAILHRLIARSDVLIENFSARVMENFGLGWETVREINPSLVMLRMPAFGLDGPWRDRPGFAMTVEQVSGLAWITGYRDMPLVVRGACDPLGGMHAVFALALALEERRRSGRGQLVELALAEAAINLAAEQVLEYSAYGALLERDENRGPVSAPQGVYQARDPEALVALAVPDDERWQALRTVMGDPAWAARDALRDAAGRRLHHDAIDAELEGWLRTREADEVVAALLAAGVPAQRLINPHDLSPNAQLEARGFFQLMEHPATGKTRYPGWPMAFSALPRALHRRTPPMLGQHNDEVLRDELGLGEDELAALREAGIIGERPSFM